MPLRKRLRLLTASKPRANIVPIGPDSQLETQGPVEQYARIAGLLALHPHLAEVLVEVAERLALAEEQSWTGRIQVNLQTGHVRGGPQVKLT
jgi:hypothetical protein